MLGTPYWKHTKPFFTMQQRPTYLVDIGNNMTDLTTLAANLAGQRWRGIGDTS